MNKGKEERSDSGPVFPRLNVNDTAAKGGPRAPPRNKMALYEQISIPSHRAPLYVAYSSQGNMSHLSPYQGSPSTSGYSSSGNVNSQSSAIDKMKSTKTEHERYVHFKSVKAGNSGAGCSNLQPRTNGETSGRKVAEDDEDFRVPTFLNSERDATGTNKKGFPLFFAKRSQNGFSSAPNSSFHPLEEGTSSNVKSLNPEGNQNEENPLCHPEASTKIALSSKFSKSSLERDDNTTIISNEQTCLRSCERDAQSADTLKVRSGSHVATSRGSHQSSPNETDNCNRDTGNMDDGQCERQDADKSNDVSDTSVADSVSGLEISPDDVVGKIGPKQFWKARRAIVNQQRVFALQVFELHRLIKVQKLFASSPHLLLEENPCTTPPKVPIKNLTIEPAKSHSPPVKPPKPSTECRKETLSATSHQAPSYASREGCSQPQKSTVQPNPWCMQPPANQWLVPVMSPSEGLIYKPFAGPCPPQTGYMPPFYTPNYFPTPYGVPPCPRPNGQSEQNSRSSCNMSFPKSDAFTGRPCKKRAIIENELQGSSASSPSSRGRDVLPLFPEGPSVEEPRQASECNGEEQLTRAIKVVPHNARSATESAARIFKSIQKERHRAE